jgi:cellulose synthase/poly-beta-1,6-N-acetylglucosamine synthase-like glycosyltransferase
VTLPFVSVVVPVRNGAATIGDLLASLKALDWPEERREIVIVDNGSTDDTAGRVRAAGLLPLVEPVAGAARARNTGAAAARGDLLVFTDADCVVSRGWLRGLTAPFADPGIGGVGGRTETFPPATATERYAARTRHLDAERHLAHPTFPFAPTGNAAYRRSAFEEIGGFDVDFTWGEPVDLAKRVVRRGWRLTYAPRALVLHRARATVEGFHRQHRGYGYSLALLCAKYRDEVVWDDARDRAAEAEVRDAFHRVLSARLEARASADPAALIETRVLDWIRLAARRAGFLAACRERRLVLNRGAAGAPAP